MSGERQNLQRALGQYVIKTLTYMTTVKTFYDQFSEWKKRRQSENDKMMDINKRADIIDPTFTDSEGKRAAFHKNITGKFQMDAESKLAELEKELDEVLKDTLEGLEELNTFVDAVEKLAVTSLDVFTENLILRLPEKIRFDDVQAVIITARQICPLLLEFKRDAKSFFLPKLHNVEVLTHQLKRYIDTTDTICQSHGKSFNFESFSALSKEIAVNSDDLSENDMEKMIHNIEQLDKIRMDEHFRIKFLFQKVSSEDFIESCDDQLQRMKDFLDELEECANQIDRVNKGAKISSKTTLVGGITGCALSVAGVALSPVTAGLSLGLTVAGVSMGAVSSTGKLVTTLTEIGINRSQLKKAVDVLKSFVEDFQMIQYCLNRVINQPTENLKPRKIDVAGVGKASEAVLQHGAALQNVSRQALHVIDIGQAAHLGPLGKGDGFAELNSNRTKIPKFLKDRAALYRSQTKSWEEIRTSFSKLTTEENKNILQKPFYPGIKKTWI